MKPVQILAVLLIVSGVLGAVYGGFSYTKNNQEAKLGPIELNFKEKKNVDIPLWASVAAIVAGGVLLVVGGKRG